LGARIHIDGGVHPVVIDDYIPVDIPEVEHKQLQVIRHIQSIVAVVVTAGPIEGGDFSHSDPGEVTLVFVGSREEARHEVALHPHLVLLIRELILQPRLQSNFNDPVVLHFDLI